jgi:hypothetical protein
MHIYMPLSVDIFGGGDDSAASRQRAIIPIDYNGASLLRYLMLVICVD